MENIKKIFLFSSFILFIIFLHLAGANTYVADNSFTLSDTIYTTNEKIEQLGYLSLANYTDSGTLVSSLSPLQNASINITIKLFNSTLVSNYTIITDSNGSFYSNNSYYKNATQITAPSTAGEYIIRAQYKDPNNTIWFSESQITVVNQSIDKLQISPEKADYNPSESVKVKIEAVKLIGSNLLHVSNVSMNGSLRNSTKGSLETFNCTTGSNGKCFITVTAPSTYGNYILEVGNYSAFSSFSVIPFSHNVYMKDELGKSLKNIYAQGEKAAVEVSINNASSSDVYTFSGNIADSSGNVIKSITSTELNSNNSFKNTFVFTADALTYSYGAYRVSVTISKTGDGSVTSSTSFEVKDWSFTIDKRPISSGFESEYTIFRNRTMYLQVYPTYRANGSIIQQINQSSFVITVKNSLNNILSSTNAIYNSSCGKGGCYEFSLQSPSEIGQYTLSVALSNSGLTQTKTRAINVVSSIMSVLTTNNDGALKELFGSNEFVYLSLTNYNSSILSFNLSDAELFSVTYMNGTEFSYTNVSNFTQVNATNSVYEWAWNSTNQRLKLDVPKYGGVYNVHVFGNNKTVGAFVRFIVNPYELCIVPKDTPGTVSSGYYYVWQFKVSDTIYFELKPIQANNPLGRATVSNFSSSNSSSQGKGDGCVIDTATQQVLTNATITVMEVRNSESGALQNVNTTASTCQASDSSGGYSCTVKPLTKWEGGINTVKFKIQGQDEVVDIDYGRFEARAFYIYGWSSNWQNSPNNNITLSLQLYEAGSGWWGSSGGLSGTVQLKRVEYQGTDGEWIWPPVESGYNVTNVSSSTITSGTGTLSLPVSAMPTGKWKSGYYRAVIQATTSSGDTDYGYAWFGIKLWDVYGSPVECTQTGCSYKSYFSSKENITLFIKISQAGNYNYNYLGKEAIGGNVTVGIKKIMDCKSWPCKELNASQYTSNTINVNESSPWYWNGDNVNQSRYLIYLNTTTASASWGTGYYSVVLNVNGTDTGNAWFNTIAFYVETNPTNRTGGGYVSSIRGDSPVYFNTTTAKNYKSGYYYGSNYLRYNESDYINATFDDAVLRVWNRELGRSIEYNYPENINVTPNNISGNGILNITFKNGSWPSGYYWGEVSLKNTANETSGGYLWFEVRPFRTSISTNTYSTDINQCVNATINLYEPSWSSNSFLYGNYSITNVYEDIWSGSSSTRTAYTNFTSAPFNATSNVTVCPNSGTGEWSSGSWGGYHYLNLVIKDNNLNDTETGWLSFRSLPYSISWGSVSGGSNKLVTEKAIVPVTLTKYSTGENTTGNLTKLYQWRYDNTFSGKEEYVFGVGDCYSNVSSRCTVNGTQNVTVYPNSRGWRQGYNYIYAEWTKQTDSSSKIEDYSGIYIDGRAVYNGYFSGSDVNGNYRGSFAENENITIRLYVRDSSYNAINANITDVKYTFSGGNCWNEWCRTYTTATWSLTSGGVQTSNGNAIIKIKVPDSGWSKGNYYIKATVSGSGGTATITDGYALIKDLNAPNVTISSPTNNQSITANTFLFNITTTESAQCSISTINYDRFHSWYCGSAWDASNSSNSSLTTQKKGACNTTLYSYNGSKTYADYLSSNYRSVSNDTDYFWSSGSTGFTTGGTTHSFTFNASNMTSQHYGINAYCYDVDYNYGSEIVAFKVNFTG